MDGTEIMCDAAEYFATMRGLKHVLVLRCDEFYTSEHVTFVAGR